MYILSIGIGTMGFHHPFPTTLVIGFVAWRVLNQPPSGVVAHLENIATVCSTLAIVDFTCS